METTSINIVIGIGILAILIVLVVLFIPSAEKKEQKKRKRIMEEQEAKLKELEQAVPRQHKHIESLKHQAASLEKEIKEKDKQLALEIAKNAKLKDKLSMDRQWHDREQAEIDKKVKEAQQLKSELAKTQDNLSKEHMQLLRSESELKEFKSKTDLLNEQRRVAESESAQLRAKVDVLTQEVKMLKRENAELAKKKEDTQWIAKTEYDRVEKLLREKDKELARIKKEMI